MAKKGYTTKAHVENYILQEINSTFDTQLDSWIDAVEKYIDKITGRNFKADVTATERLFDGDGTQDLLIDECIEITKVEVGEDDYGGTFSEVPSTGSSRYFPYPANAVVKGEPFYKLRLNCQTFPEGTQNNRVTAKWGYSEDPPADITFVATILVSGILNQARGGGDKVKSERIGNYTVQYDENDSDALADFNRAKEILSQYTRILL
jgi:hypothetical protein